MKKKHEDLEDELYRLVDKLVEVERKLIKSEISAEELRVEKDTVIHGKNLEMISLQQQVNELNALLSRKSYQFVGNIESMNFARKKAVRIFIREVLRVSIRTYQFLGRINNKLKSVIKISPKPKNSKTRDTLISDLNGEGLSNSQKTKVTSSPVESREILSELYDGNLEKSKYYEELDQSTIFMNSSPLTNLIAFYLPQFHPIKENDRWWGKGFTEWTNVSRALPLFKGHYQPRLPGELGYYDLRVPDVQKRQIELAKIAGIKAFCMYFYWFNGKTLLEKPLKQLFEDKSLDINYCLCWANENWTRTWDGLDKEILIEQEYSKENNLNFIKYVSKYFSDKRYMRIDGKPVLLIYRVNHFPRPGETIKTFREYCSKSGIGEIYIAGVQGFGMKDPTLYGCDASVEFPPHSIGEELKVIGKKAPFGDKKFKGVAIYDIKEFIKERRYIKNNWSKMFRGIMLNWDNTPRKAKLGSVFYGLTPTLYQNWLTDIIRLNRGDKSLEEKMVFLNAWNEWGEGSYLEPDRKFGYAFLNATKDALLQSYLPKKKIVCVGHDAHLHGAQQLLLAIVKELKLRFGYEVKTILLEGGVLEKEYAKYSDVEVVTGWTHKKLDNLLADLRKSGFDECIFNTSITGRLAKLAEQNGFKFISLIHELPGIIREKNAVEDYKSLVSLSEKVIVASDYVKERNQKAFKTNTAYEIIPQGIYKQIPNEDRKKIKEKIRTELNISMDAKVMIGVGYGDKRKGIDIFVETALEVCKKQKDIYFLWIGNLDERYVLQMGLKEKIKKENIGDRIKFLSYTEEIMEYFAASDIYLLTSREDPFPSVVLEAMSMGNPVITFDDSGGFSKFITNKIGRVVPKGNIKQFTETVIKLSGDEDSILRMGVLAEQSVKDNFLMKDYVYKLLELLGHDYKKVTVVVPNYNYSNYLPARIKSIVDQTYPIYEIILLDDASTDNSEDVILKIQKDYSFYDIQTDFNKLNSGKVYIQWVKGIKKSKGDYIWIAEADDLAEKLFLEEAVKGFYIDEKVVLSYTQSKNIDQSGNTTSDDMKYYTDDIDKDKFRFNYLNTGLEEIKSVLCIKNTIPNVSGVLFIKDKGLKAIKNIEKYEIAGDWLFYLNLLETGKLYFSKKSLNINRRHNKSVVASKEKNKKHYNEIVRIQEYCIKRFKPDTEIVNALKEYRKKVKKILLSE